MRDFLATPITLGLRVYLLMLPVTLLAAVFAVPDPTPHEMLLRAGAGVAAQACVGLVLLIAWGVVRRLTHPHFFVVLSVVIAYAIRGGILALLFSTLDAPDNISPFMRVIGSTFTMSIWTLILGAALQAREHYHAQLSRTLKRASDIERRAEFRAQSDERLSVEFTATRDRIGRVLDDYSDADLASWSQVVRRTIEDDLRPFSHRLWASSAQGPSRWERMRQFTWRVANSPIPLVPAALVLVALLGWNSVLRYGSAEGGATAGAYAGCLVLVVWLLALLRKRRLLSVVQQNLVDLLGLTLLAPAMMLGLTLVWSALPGEGLGLFALALGGLTIIVIQLAIWAAVTTSRSLAEQAEVDVDALDLLMEARAQVRSKQLSEAARYLHNSVQSRLLRLQVQADTGVSNPLLAGEISAARSDIRTLVLDQLPDTNRALPDLQASVESWSGIVDIDLSITGDFPGDHHAAGHLALFAQEAIANSIRHGSATDVHVTLSGDHDRPKLVVEDNGTWLGEVGISGQRHGDLMITVERTARGTRLTGLPIFQ